MLHPLQRRQRAHSVNSYFVLRALAAQNLLQQRKTLRRCAAGNSDIQARRGENDTVKDQVADKADLNCRKVNFPVIGCASSGDKVDRKDAGQNDLVSLKGNNAHQISFSAIMDGRNSVTV